LSLPYIMIKLGVLIINSNHPCLEAHRDNHTMEHRRHASREEAHSFVLRCRACSKLNVISSVRRKGPPSEEWSERVSRESLTESGRGGFMWGVEVVLHWVGGISSTIYLREITKKVAVKLSKSCSRLRSWTSPCFRNIDHDKIGWFRDVDSIRKRDDERVLRVAINCSSAWRVVIPKYKSW
jgi:hypothetical protein